MTQASSRTAVLIIAATVLLTSCADPGSDSGAGSAQDEGSPGGLPEFSGPWAAEFEEAYVSATSDFERSALNDGFVSEQEYAEMTDRFDGCLADAGVTFEGFRDGGEFDFTFPESLGATRAHDVADACSRSSGEASIGMIYSFVTRNPEHRDENAIMSECLVEEAVVEPGYSAAAYASDIVDETYPFSTDHEAGMTAVRLCESDPLALVGLRQR